MADTLFVMNFVGEAPADSTEFQQHVTFLSHAQVFESADVACFMEETAVVTAGMEPFFLPVAGNEWFGAEQDIHVQTIGDPDGKALELHLGLLNASNRNGLVSSQPEYTGLGFRPHMTVTPHGKTFLVGDSVLIDTLTIVRHSGGFGGEMDTLGLFQLGKN